MMLLMSLLVGSFNILEILETFVIIAKTENQQRRSQLFDARSLRGDNNNLTGKIRSNKA